MNRVGTPHCSPQRQPTKKSMRKRDKIFETPEIPKDPEAFRGQASSDLVVRLRHHHLPILRGLTEAGQHCEAKPRQMRQHQDGTLWLAGNLGELGSAAISSSKQHEGISVLDAGLTGSEPWIKPLPLPRKSSNHSKKLCNKILLQPSS